MSKVKERFIVVRFVRGFAVVNKGTGERESGFYSGMALADERCQRMNLEAARELRLLRRACLCCGAGFMSEGAHNRLCDRCRRRGQDYDPAMMVDHVVEGL